ncbi:hypothetical protein ACWEPL_47150 [Nonomuraea sp. NPDC004186]
MPHAVQPGVLGVPRGGRQVDAVAPLHGDSRQDDADREAVHALHRATSIAVEVNR